MMRLGVPANRAQGAFFYGDLWRFLYEGLPEGMVKHGHTVESLGEDIDRPMIDGEAFDMVVIADGGWSGLRRYVTTAEPKYAGYVGYRGCVPREAAPWFDAFGIHKNGIFDTIIMPQAYDDGTQNVVCGAVVATPESEVMRPSVGVSRHGTEEDKRGVARHKHPVPDWFLPLYRQNFGHVQGGQLARLFETVASIGELKVHPQFEFGAERVTKGRVVLVGDAAHMASPRTAVGAHTAVLDAVGLREAFTAAGGDVEAALQLYAPDGLERAQQLWARTQQVSRDFLPPGGKGGVVSPASLVHVPVGA